MAPFARWAGAIAVGLLLISGVQSEDKKKKEPSPDKPKTADTKTDTGPFKHLKYRSIGPAAGGRITRSCGIPGDPNIYYVGAASGGVWKTTDAGVTWKPIFDDQPTSSIGAVAVAPSDPNVVYVGSGEANIRGNVAPGNGIYVSTNGGKSWQHVWKQVGQIGHIVVHPRNADIAYAAVLGSVFHRPTYFSKQWETNPERGVYRTTDGGKTWKRVLTEEVQSKTGGGSKEKGFWSGSISRNTGAIDISIDPNNPRILFAALWETERSPWSMTSGGRGSGLHRSDDGGDTWEKIGPTKYKLAANIVVNLKDKDKDNGLPDGPYGRIGVAMAPSDSRRVYALIEAENGGLYRSDDGGEKWTLASGARYLRQRPWYFSTVHVDPKNPDIVYCPSVRFARSVDGGKTFKQMKGLHHPDHHDLWIDPLDPRRMIDSHDGGVDITTNGGATWHAPHLPICQFYHISVDNSVPYRVLGNMQDQGTASGPSHSLSSAGIALSDWHTVGGGETGFAVADPTDPNLVYAGEYSGYLSLYDHRTRLARNIGIYPTNPSGKGAEDLRYRFQWTAPIVISPHDPKTIYHAANVLFRTKNQGKTWEKISPDLTTNDRSKQKWSGGPITGDNTGVEYYCTIFAVAESPKQAGVLWAGSDDGLVHVSLDAGTSWQNVTKNIPGIKPWATVACIEASPHEPGTAYVVVEAHRLDDNAPYLYMTKDFGKSWSAIASNLPSTDYLRVVREDPTTPGLLYVGSETQVHFSRDHGKKWESLKLNMPTVAISDLHVKGNDLVVGTNGRSIWIFDDLTPIRQAEVRKDREQKLELLPIQPATRWRLHGENYAGADRLPGANPPKGAILHYLLPADLKGELTLEVHDEKGTLMQKLSSKKPAVLIDPDSPDAPSSIFKPTVLPKEPGLNRVAWDLEMLGPTVIPGAKNDAGVPYRGPLVLPGTYTVTLKLGDQAATREVVVKIDPRFKATRADLAEAHQLAVRVRDEITRLSEIVIALQSVRSQLQARLKLLEMNARAEPWRMQAREVVGKLDALEAELHNPKAEVTYDILAKKGGAKLYSQLAPFYDTVKDSDGPVTQGMREVHAENGRELERLADLWSKLLADDIARLNAEARTLELPIVAAPAANKK